MKDNNMLVTEGENQFTISHELLALLRWLVVNEEEPLQNIIKKALKTGLNKNLQQQTAHMSEQALTDTIQSNVVEFFALLEMLLLESLEEQAVQRAFEHNLLPAVDKIDSTLCDDETVRTSIAKTTEKLSKDASKNAHELLFKELLKQWRPHKKTSKN